MSKNFDTIAAIASPPGFGGISIVRLSGSGALACLQEIFVPKYEDNFTFTPRYMHYGQVLDKKNQVLDEVLAVYMPGPNSATGEDVAEIHCHGGLAITNALLESVLDRDCRLAEAGEFTKRAFLNGRIDLAQAEAVAEAINAPTREGVRLAEAKMSGALSRKIESLLEAVNALRSHIVAAVDFSDDIDMMPRSLIEEKIEKIKLALDFLTEAYKRARLWREGASVVLAGQVNAGKSSLLNSILGRNRAIVSDIPGTTRDYIEENIYLEGLQLRLTDTAGLRQSEDLVESEGIRRAGELYDEADVLVLVVDGKSGFAEADFEFLNRYKELPDRAALLVAINKSDTFPEEKYADFLKENSVPACLLSAHTGDGIARLMELVAKELLSSQKPVAGDIAPNLRQSALLEKAKRELDFLRADLDLGLPEDILSLRLDDIATYLEEVTGRASSDDVLGMVFSDFCIGK